MIKTKSKWLLIILTLAIIFACIFFPCLNLIRADGAAIEGHSGNKFVLTGLSGTSPEHFFVDDNKNSTLVNAEITSGGVYNKVVGKGKGASSGWGEYCPTADMAPFIEKGIVYIQATATVSGSEDVTITISSGEDSASATAEKGEIKTELLQMKSVGNIKFSFTASGNGSKNRFSMEEPTIHIYTEIDSVTLDCADQDVTPGQALAVNAYNDVTAISGASGNFMSFSKINHEIQFEFNEGDDKYVSVVNSNIIINRDAPENTQITFRVFSKKNSYSQDKIYSENYVTLTVKTGLVNIKVRTDFENPATFTNEKAFVVGRKFNITIKPNKGFIYKGFYIDGELFADSSKLLVTVEAIPGQDLYAKFVKQVSVSQIEIPSKVYDGTCDIDESTAAVKFDGLENGHELGLEGFELSFTNPNVGNDKLINTSFDSLTLTGKDKELYQLLNNTLPQVVGQITKREAFVTAESAEIEYGYNNPDFKFSTTNMVEGDEVKGSLSREPGFAIGEYRITLGNLNEVNQNYNFSLVDNGAVLRIVPRTIYLDSIRVEDKTYDKTTDAVVTSGLRNVYNNEDVSAQIKAYFVDANANMNVEVVIDQASLSGNDKGNYKLDKDFPQIFGNILPRDINVEADEKQFVYGDEMEFTYSVTGMLEGDDLSGELTVDDISAGEHPIQIGTLSNPNYKISFKTATCTILPKEALIKAHAASKIYGDEEPVIEFDSEGVINGDTFTGGLSRTDGKNVGEYEITLGDLYNKNYNLTLESNIFTITPRPIKVKIKFLDKIYDGTNGTTFKAYFDNNIENEKFDVTCQNFLDDIECGMSTVTLGEAEAYCENVDNYTFTFEQVNDQIEIKKRDADVLVSNLSKAYGSDDPEFTYSIKNLVGDDNFEVVIKRESGENVGLYLYSLASDTSNIRNYNVTVVESYFQIIPKEIKVEIENYQKIFGEKDPELTCTLIDSLCFGQTEEEIVDGKITRQKGENVGVYSLDLSKLSSSKNYTFVSENENFIINKRDVTVVAQDVSKTYGDADPIFNYTVYNEVPGEKLTVKLSRDYGEDAGREYPLTCLTKNDARYNINFVSANLFIVASDISVKADEKVKIYGEEDPALSIVITKGFLKNNDRLEDITMGLLVRDEGENIGSYTIRKGSFSLGKNYNMTFEEGQFIIIKRDASITIKPSQKIYGESDPEFEFDVEGLAFTDKVQGDIKRDEGEDVGTYRVYSENFSINENYEISVTFSTLEITQREVFVNPTVTSKFYGESEPEITYEADDLIGEDKLSGALTRQQLSEEVGRYKIDCTLENPNYKVIFNEQYFSILPRNVTLQAQDKTIYYGDDEPELTYTIISGQILEGDEISGSLARKGGANAGEYDIISTLTLGKNYNINYIKGKVTILPLNLTISCPSLTKIYGQVDPKVDYQIVDGKLINGDKLMGSVIRQEGEDVGTYQYLGGVYNDNYNVKLIGGSLEILKKDCVLVTDALDKIYDGTTVAKLKTPYVTGLIDKDVYLDYDLNDIANFESCEIGNSIKVTLHDITLFGEKASNYQLVYPTDLYANITYPSLTENGLVLTAKEAVLLKDYSLNYTLNADNGKLKGHRLAQTLNVWLDDGGKSVDVNSKFNINVQISKKVYEKHNIFVYQRLANGDYRRVEAKKIGNNCLEISSANLGQLYITVEDDSWIKIGSYISIGLIAFNLVVLICYFGYVKIKKNKKNKELLG